MVRTVGKMKTKWKHFKNKQSWNIVRDIIDRNAKTEQNKMKIIYDKYYRENDGYGRF